MRHLAVFLLAAGSAMAADFNTGQAARAVIGQPTFTAQTPTSSDVIVGGVSGLAYANGTLFVTDSNRVGAGPMNNRVLIFNNMGAQLPTPTAEIQQSDTVRCPVCVGKANVVLGQSDFTGADWHVTATGMRTPTSVATDGVHIVVADTDNNRVLIWNSIPNVNGTAADVVLGQPDFTSFAPNNRGKGTVDVNVPTASSLRGPQGVWIQAGKLYVADDMNHRVLIWNSIPTSNFKEADVVLGQPSFASATQPDLVKQDSNATASSMLNPVAVTSDGVRLFVTDLGHHRVMIWNAIPTSNNAPADVVIGQPNKTNAVANYTGSGGLCPATGVKDSEGKDTYPGLCGATLSYPRYALSDGTRLFVADGGNDRVLIFNTIPTADGTFADKILGQIDGTHEQTSDSSDNPDIERRAGSDAIRTPMSLAWDGVENLYVSEPYSRRVLVFSVGSPVLPLTNVRNAASMEVYSIGAITFAGTITKNDKITIKIGRSDETTTTDYKYTIKDKDTFDIIIDGFVDLINAGDGNPWVFAHANKATSSIILTSRVGGITGDSTTLATTTSTSATITATASGTALDGGGYAAKIAPGTIVSIFGTDLAETTASAPSNADPLPTTLAGVQVYFDGRRAPLLGVSPTQINAQVPFEIYDASSINAFVRTVRKDGSVTSSTPLGVTIVKANPGIFAEAGTDPRPGILYHGSSQATGTILVDGTAKAGDVASVIIEDRTYSYTLVENDTLAAVRDNLIDQINANDPKVYAVAGGEYTRIRLRARVEGPEGNGIPFGVKETGDNVTMTATSSALCCANFAGARVTEANPAVPGETLTLYATGLGIVGPEEAKNAVYTGFSYKGPVGNAPVTLVDSIMAGGKTAQILYAGMAQYTVGVYQVEFELNSSMTTNPLTQITIAQETYVSNIVTFPVIAQ